MLMAGLRPGRRPMRVSELSAALRRFYLAELDGWLAYVLRA